MSDTPQHDTINTPLVPQRSYLKDDPDQNPAAELIRKKIATLYKQEPDAVDEAVESSLIKQRSKHQQFMYELSTSGKPLAEVQTAWHQYYTSLNDKEKHEVWQEFYAAQHKQSALFQAAAATPTPLPELTPSEPQIITGSVEPTPTHTAPKSSPSIADLKKQITSKVRVRGKLSRKQHLKSLGFGLGMGALMVLVLLFGFFNERFVAPFITPSRSSSATPLILDPTNATIDKSPQIIIPKINVQTPTVYDVPTIEEADVQAGLERGIVHYVTTSNPGEQGNAVFFGHSSSNILNRGKYKFAFVLLSWLNTDDTFYVQKDGIRYVYKVIDKKVVRPTDISVLDPIPGKPATATLITCDPPGTNVNRLVIVGEQISPDPITNIASSAKPTETPKQLAGNSESLWHRFVNAIF
jgi:LPXTG-site transpeptidase (sortase) family protein